MSGISMRIKLDDTVINSMRRDDIMFSERHTDQRVGGIQGPEVAGPFATYEQWTDLVNHALAFNKEVVSVYDLGDNLPPIAVVKGERPVGNRRCDTHEPYNPRNLRHDQPCKACEVARGGDNTTVKYVLRGYGFNTLSDAIIMAIALRDRRNPNDAMATSRCIQRLLSGDRED